MKIEEPIESISNTVDQIERLENTAFVSNYENQVFCFIALAIKLVIPFFSACLTRINNCKAMHIRTTELFI
jgi:hypothetical protein